MVTIKEKIERWILLTEQLLKENKSVYIKDINDNYFMGDIVLIGEEKITIDCFAPPQRANKRELIRWINVTKCMEYNKEVRQ